MIEQLVLINQTQNKEDYIYCQTKLWQIFKALALKNLQGIRLI